MKIVNCKNCKYFVVGYDFSCCKLTEAIVGEDDYCSKGKENGKDKDVRSTDRTDEG